MISTFYKDHPEKPIATSPSLDAASPMARPTVSLFNKQKQGRLKRHTMKRIMWGDKEESESIWFSKKPEAGRRPKICLFGAKSVGELAFWWMELFVVQLCWKLNSTLFWLSLSFHHKSFGFPPTFSHQVLEIFHWLILLSGFPPQFPITGLGGFLSVTWSFETHQLSYRARIFSFFSGFPPQSLS